MFSGIIQSVGKIVSIHPVRSRPSCGTAIAAMGRLTSNRAKSDSGDLAQGFRLVVEVPLQKVSAGESISVDGVCLTVVGRKKKKSQTQLTFDVAEETARKSTLGRLLPKKVVNLERALKIGEPLGGHFVQGHVDAKGKILKIQEAGNSKLYWFSYPAFLQSCLVPKGSIAVDGISLTIVDVSEESFSVAILPFTEQNTSLRFKKIGEEVNLEGDILAKTVARQFQLLKQEFFRGEKLEQKINLDWDARMAEKGK